jgi:integrase
MLTAAGALPARDEDLARAGQWLAGVLEAISPAADRRLVQAYATWQVMRRLRASAAAASRPRTPTAHARNHIRAAAALLAWLRGRGTTLEACGQGDIDQWLRTGPSACLARDFLVWAAARGHCQRLTIPPPPRPAGPAISQDQRWALTARLLRDAALDPTDRVAGCLLLLYGQPLSRIAATTTSQITRRDDQTFIRLGRHDVPVPGPLADALRQLISGGRSYRGVGSPPATTWLFPGHLPGRPITPDTLGGRLRALGIYAQTGRRAALLDLAAQLPAAVLADLLGLHQNTAARWMHQAGGDWSRYAAELARHPHQP